METFLTFLLASILTIYFVRRYLKSLAVSAPSSRGKAAHSAGGAEPKKVPCPRCGHEIVKGVPFCSQCGAALSLWTVHQAAVQSAGSGDSAAPGKLQPVINTAICIGCGGCVGACPEIGVLDVVNGKSVLVNPDGCVGHAVCANACPTQALSLAHGNVLQTIRVPDIQANFESSVPGIFVIGEMGGMGLIKTAINEGRLVIDHLRKRLGIAAPAAKGHAHAPEGGEHAAGEPETKLPEHAMYDIAIVGAGPAGLSASLTAHQYGMRYLTLEQGAVASTIKQYPRHKFLMSEPVEMPLYGSLYIADGSKESLLSVWEAIIANTGVHIHTGQKVQSVCRENGGFVLQVGDSTYKARQVVLAMGKRGTPRRLNVPGEELPKVAYNLIEAETYDDKDLLVVGGGDSAIEAAAGLSKAGKNRVTLSYRGADFKRARERNQQLLEEAEREGRMRILRESQVLEISSESVRLQTRDGEVTLPNHYVFIMIGGESPEEFMNRTGIRIVEKALIAPS